MPPTCWYHFLSKKSSAELAAIGHSLAKAGMKAVAYTPETVGPAAPESAGVVFFAEHDPAIHDFLNYASFCGRHRIIAVCESGNLDTERIWTLMQAGASDVIDGPFEEKSFAKIAARIGQWTVVKDTIESPRVASNLIGESQVWRVALRQIVDVALDSDLSVLITGESGTGKELAAQLIHSLDKQRSNRRFVVLDCTTIVPELSGSEFFGHERGSFTGAFGRREGAFALADGGTLFLDEVGELPLLLQAELLRVIQEKRYKPIGGNAWKTTNFRLICATNRELLEQQRQGRFRSDLYHRIATWTCHLPPLRDRSEDIIPLANYFLTKVGSNGNEPPVLDTAVCEYLRNRDYPGNVRELFQLIRRISCRNAGAGIITCGDIPESDRPMYVGRKTSWKDEVFESVIRRALSQGADLDEIRSSAEDIAEVIALQQAGGNGKRNGAIARAAKMLNINRRTLEMHIKNRSDRMHDRAH